MLNIICWKWDKGLHVKKKIRYNARHVNILYKNCLKNIDIPFKFTCITDNKRGLNKDIQTIPVWNDFEKYGWCYRRLKTFSKEMIPILGERILSIDLDCIILKNITSLIDNDNDFMIWKSGTNRAPFSGSMWMMNIGIHQDIWDDFKEEDLISTGHKHYQYQNKYAIQAGFNVGSDQSWLNYKLANKNIKYWSPNDGIYNFRTIFGRKSQNYDALNKAKIIFFSGSADPSQRKLQQKHPWIKKYWTVKNKKTEIKKKEMKIITVQFNYRNDWYDRLLRAFRNSVNLQMPDVGLTEYIYNWNASKNEHIERSASMGYNTFKLEKWVEILENAEEKICFTDCDMLMTNRIDDVWKHDFDVAYTYREKWKNSGQGIPYNGGVVFVRPNERSINFFKRWLEINNKMIVDSSFHSGWRKKYAGMNQAAFGYVLEKEPEICKMLELPCPIWNSVDESWRTFNQHTKMVHIKSNLRKTCLGLKKAPINQQYIVDLWKWHETLDEHKLETYDKIIYEEDLTVSRPVEPIPLTIIVPKLNDPHQEAKIMSCIHMKDEILIFKSTKQNYRKIIEKAKYDDILVVNPNNYAVLNKPNNIDTFRHPDRFVVNNVNSIIRSSIKIKKEDALKHLKSEKITFRTLLSIIQKNYKDYRIESSELKEVYVPFDWKKYIEKDKLIEYCTNENDVNEQYYIEV